MLAGYSKFLSVSVFLSYQYFQAVMLAGYD